MDPIHLPYYSAICFFFPSEIHLSMDRCTNDIFLSTGVTAGYASNSAPIDDIDILRSIPASGREVYFPLKISTLMQHQS